MKEKKAKLTGPKFRQYFLLHLKFVKTEILASIFMGWFAGWIWGGLDREKCLIITMIIGGWSLRAFGRICSGMLYQQEAYFYQSFPVSAFETVFVKVITGALVPAAGLLPMTIQMYGMASLTAVPAIIAGSILFGNIMMAAIGFGNGARDSRAKKPSTIITVIAALLMMAAQIFGTLLFVYFSGMDTALMLLILFAVFLIEAGLLMWFNVWNLQKNYRV